MDTKLATKQIRLQQWAEIIRDCRTSGLQVKDYCSQHGISRDAYFYWLRKVKEAALLHSGFVELPVPAKKESTSGSSFVSQLIIDTGSVRIEINNDTPAELIHRTLEAVIHVK